MDSIDIDPERLAAARGYLERGGVAGRVELIEGAALEVIHRLQGPFDLVYMDAVKTEYRRYLDLVVPKLRVGGVVVCDNLLWGGAGGGAARRGQPRAGRPARLQRLPDDAPPAPGGRAPPGRRRRRSPPRRSPRSWRWAGLLVLREGSLQPRPHRLQPAPQLLGRWRAGGPASGGAPRGRTAPGRRGAPGRPGRSPAPGPRGCAPPPARRCRRRSCGPAGTRRAPSTGSRDRRWRPPALPAGPPGRGRRGCRRSGGAEAGPMPPLSIHTATEGMEPDVVPFLLVVALAPPARPPGAART